MFLKRNTPFLFIVLVSATLENNEVGKSTGKKGAEENRNGIETVGNTTNNGTARHRHRRCRKNFWTCPRLVLVWTLRKRRNSHAGKSMRKVGRCTSAAVKRRGNIDGLKSEKRMHRFREWRVSECFDFRFFFSIFFTNLFLIVDKRYNFPQQHAVHIMHAWINLGKKLFNWGFFIAHFLRDIENHHISLQRRNRRKALRAANPKSKM